MDKVYEELDEAKAEIEKLRVELKCKADLSENLKKAHSEVLTQLKDANFKLEKQAHKVCVKEEEISEVKKTCADLQISLKGKESTIGLLSTANDNLRVDCVEKQRKWDEEKRNVVLALDEANEKNVDLEQKVNVFRAEIEGLKGLLSASKRKCREAERNGKAQRELIARDDMLLKLEEENRKFEDQLKWKKEQFTHLEEAHQKLRDQFRESKKEWEKEKSKMIEDICSLQTNLDSQIRISKALDNRLKMCNDALAHEQGRRKYLEVELSEFRTQSDNVFIECQDAKSQLEILTAQRDEEIAALRLSLGTNETYCKELEYRAGILEQENEELLAALKELREAQIQQVGNSSSLAKLQNKLRSVEQMHKDCSANLRAKEIEWNSKLETLNAELNHQFSALQAKETAVKELELELERCISLIMQLKLQMEEASVTSLVLKSSITEASSNLQDVEHHLTLCDKEREERISLLLKQLEMKNAALHTAQTEIEEEQKKRATLSEKLEFLELAEEERLLNQKELERCKVMLEESSKSQVTMKERALQAESDLEEKIQALCGALDMANSKLAEESAKVLSLSKKAESFALIEEKQQRTQKETESYKVMLEESSRNNLLLEEKVREALDALDLANSSLTTERSRLAEESEKVTLLSRKAVSLDLIQEKQQRMQRELESYKDNLEESSRNQLLLEESLREALAVQDLSTSELTEERSRVASLSRELESLKLVKEQELSTLKELDRCKEILELSSRNQILLEEKAERMEADLKKELRQVCEALTVANSELAQEREKTSTLSERVESFNVVKELKEQQLLLQEELEKYKGMLEASTCQLKLQEQSEKETKEELQKVTEALDRVNSDLAAKICEGHEVEFELWLWKTIAQRSKDDLEDNQALRKDLEASLLAQVELADTINQERHILETKLITSEALIDELNNDVMKLLSERKRLVSFLAGICDRISQISNEDLELMGTMESIAQYMDYSKADPILHDDGELFEPLKENKEAILSPTTKRSQAVPEERSPFREIN